MVKNEKGEILVAVGIIISPRNNIYLAQRPEKEFKGFFEFPGGKLEAGETACEALYRELSEEASIKKEDILSVKYFDTFSEKTEKNTYSLLCHLVYLAHENIKNDYHSSDLWCSIDSALNHDIIPTNFSILAQLKKVMG